MILLTKRSSDVFKTQDDAMSEITDLSFEDDSLRKLLKSLAMKRAGLLRYNPLVWHNIPKPLQTKFDRMVVALTDVNADIKYLLRSFAAVGKEARFLLRERLRQYLLCVLYEYLYIAVH